MKVLTPSEVERIEALDMDSGGTVYREIMTWCIHEIHKLEYMQPRQQQLQQQQWYYHQQPQQSNDHIHHGPFCGIHVASNTAVQTPPPSTRQRQQGWQAPSAHEVNERDTASSTSQEATLQYQRGTTGTVAPTNVTTMAVGSSGIDSHVANQLRGLVIELRRSVATIYDVHDQPISFFVVHFICLLSSFYLPLSAIKIGMMNVGATTTHTRSFNSMIWPSNITAGTTIEYDYEVDNGDHPSNPGIDYNYYFLLNDILSGWLVLIQCVFILGLRLLANQMEKPYNGCDVKDLSVIHYISKFASTFPIALV